MIDFLYMLYKLIMNAISIYSVVLIIYILMSWVPSMRENAFGRFVGLLAEPYLSFFRRFIPPLGMIDFSPIIAIFALRLISGGVTTVFNMLLQAMI